MQRVWDIALLARREMLNPQRKGIYMTKHKELIPEVA